jgi:hypothetical protein
MIANAKPVGNPPQSSAESREIPAYRVLIALAQTPVLAALTRHRSKNPADRGKRLSDGARLFVMRLASRFSHFVPDPKAPAYLIGRAEADRQNRATRWTAWETQRHTANGLGCNERTVRRYLVEAVDAGIVTVEAQTTRDEHGKPRTWNRYAVRFPAYWFNERRMDDGTSRTAAWIAKPPERRKRKPKAAPTHGALPDELPRHDDWDAEPPCLTPDETHAEPLDPIPDLPPEWRETCRGVETTERTEMSASERTEMSANTGNGEWGPGKNSAVWNLSCARSRRTPDEIPAAVRPRSRPDRRRRRSRSLAQRAARRARRGRRDALRGDGAQRQP